MSTGLSRIVGGPSRCAGKDVVPPGWTWCRRDGRGAAGKDVVPPGWTWCRREGRGAAGKDVVPPGRMWCCREGCGSVLRESAAFLEVATVAKMDVAPPGWTLPRRDRRGVVTIKERHGIA